MFLTSDIEGAPTALLHSLKHYKVLHEHNVILTVLTADTPRVPDDEKVTIDAYNDLFYRVVVRFGYIETPNIPKALALARKLGWKFDIMSTSFFLSRRSLKAVAQGAADLARPGVHRAGAERHGCDRILPHSDRPRGRDRHAGSALGGGHSRSHLRAVPHGPSNGFGTDPAADRAGGAGGARAVEPDAGAGPADRAAATAGTSAGSAVTGLSACKSHCSVRCGRMAGMRQIRVASSSTGDSFTFQFGRE